MTYLCARLFIFRTMKEIKNKKPENLQVPGNKLPENELAKLIKEAEKGPFLQLKDHNKTMKKWIQENSRL